MTSEAGRQLIEWLCEPGCLTSESLSLDSLTSQGKQQKYVVFLRLLGLLQEWMHSSIYISAQNNCKTIDHWMTCVLWGSELMQLKNNLPPPPPLGYFLFLFFFFSSNIQGLEHILGRWADRIGFLEENVTLELCTDLRKGPHHISEASWVFLSSTFS